jgi:hypothetical protein
MFQWSFCPLRHTFEKIDLCEISLVFPVGSTHFS